MKTLVEDLTGKLANFSSKLRPYHWFLLGGIFSIAINITIFASILFMDTASFLLITLMVSISRFFGFSDEQAWNLVNIIYNDQTIIEDPYKFQDMLTYVTDFISALISWFGYTSRAVFNKIKFHFPVLSELTLDLDWINLDLSKILRSLFSIIQFALIFYFSLKVKKYLKKILKKDQDIYDQKYFQITVAG